MRITDCMYKHIQCILNTLVVTMHRGCKGVYRKLVLPNSHKLKYRPTFQHLIKSHPSTHKEKFIGA